MRATLLILLAVLVCVAITTDAERSDAGQSIREQPSTEQQDARHQHQALRQQFLREVELLRDGVTGAAREALDAWLVPYHTARRHFVIPVDLLPPDGDRDPDSENSDTTGNRVGKEEIDLSPVERQATGNEWSERWHEARQRHAHRLVELAQRLDDDDPIVGELLLESLREDPTNRAARESVGRLFPTLRSRAMPLRARHGTTRERELGWPPGRYHRIHSTHYQLLSNSDVAASRRLTRALERLYVTAQVLFQPVGNQVLDGGRRRSDQRQTRRSRPLRVVQFATKEEYTTFLKPQIPQIGMTLGYFDPGRRTCYFFADVDDDETMATVLHEATHQLLQELFDPITGVGEERDFWIVEGIALYMESCHFGPGYVVMGGPDTNRVQYARYRALHEGYYVPLTDLLSLGRNAFQQHPELRRLYSQSAGLTHWFLDSPDLERRIGLLRYLRHVYLHDDREPDTLTYFTRLDPTEIDKRYVNDLRLTDPTLRQLVPRWPATLCFGHTDIAPEGVAALGEYRDVRWLDLAEIPISDSQLRRLPIGPALRQLNLEGTQISDAGLSVLARAPGLEELDLSGTSITDAGVASIKGLARLTTLWLAHTGITDDAVEQLLRLRRLEALNVQGCNLSPSAIDRLRSGLPDTTISAQ